MASAAPFVPAQPPRVPDLLPSWRFFFGERLRNAVYGLAEPVFDEPYLPRRFLHMRTHIVSDPAMIGHVLLDRAENYARPEVTRKMLRPLLGDGLLNAEGPSWKRQRQLVAPSFAPGAVARMTGLMAEAAERQVERWPSGPAVLDMATESTNATMEIIARGLFSGDPRLISADAGAHIARVVAAAGQPRLLSMFGLGHLDFSASMRAQRRSERYLRQSVAAMVRERGASGGEQDFFGGLLRAFHQSMSADEAEVLALDNALTFFVAGHETTAAALTWSAYLLAGQPALQERVREAVLTEGETAPLLRQLLDEAMRLYPPVVLIIREALADDDMCGAAVRQGDVVMIYPWIVHRHRRLWDRPDAFDIDRFAPGRRDAYHRFQYVPFGAGPRICVGARFAVTEALIILAAWLRSRRFRLTEGLEPMPFGTITMRPRHGLPLRVEPI